MQTNVEVTENSSDSQEYKIAFFVIIQEVENILQHVVRRNRIRQELNTKQQALEAWRQVTEVLLTGCPEDLLTAEDRQTVLFELLQELQRKVTGV